MTIHISINKLIVREDMANVIVVGSVHAKERQAIISAGDGGAMAYHFLHRNRARFRLVN